MSDLLRLLPRLVSRLDRAEAGPSIPPYIYGPLAVRRDAIVHVATHQQAPGQLSESPLFGMPKTFIETKPAAIALARDATAEEISSRRYSLAIPFSQVRSVELVVWGLDVHHHVDSVARFFLFPWASFFLARQLRRLVRLR